MTTDDAERDANDIFARTSEVVSASNWTTELTWGPCESPREGHVQFVLVAQSLTDIPTPTSTLAQAVVDSWQQVGRQPVITSDESIGKSGGLVISDPANLTGTNADGSLTQLSLSDDAVFLQVVSPCIAGDLDQVRRATGPRLTPPSTP